MTDAIIDPVAFAELQENAGEDFVRELIDTFLEEAPPMLEQLKEALDAGNAEGFRRTAHSLKSNSHTFGAMSLGALARALELGGLEADVARLDALEAEYGRAAAVLESLRHG